MDTGATHSIVNPGLCNLKWKINSANLTLKTLQSEILTNTIYQIPLFSELGNASEKMLLIECKFHDNYDGIIGNDILCRHKSVIDYDQNELRINGNILPLRFPNLRKVTFVSKVKCGLVHIVEHRNDLGATIISEGIYNVQNYKIEVETVVECPEIIYLNKNNSWPVTPDNCYLVDDNIKQ